MEECIHYLECADLLSAWNEASGLGNGLFSFENGLSLVTSVVDPDPEKQKSR